MVRACCVNTCKSGNNVPSHAFPKDKGRCRKWLVNLCLTNVEDEKEIKKLRVCHKHFKEDDYSGSATRRVLIHSAIPSTNIAQENVEMIEANITKETSLIDAPCKQENVGMFEANITKETLLIDAPCKQENTNQHQEISLTEIQTTWQKQIQEVLHRHDVKLQQQQEEIETLRKTLYVPRNQIRPDLKEVTRKNRLSFKSKRLYKARRYTIEEKMFCIDKQMENITFDTGCNNIIYKYLKLVAKEIDPKDLNIILIWDEMLLQPSIAYDKKKDKIIGFEDWGMQRTRKFADHAILFYIRCLSSGNRMPLGYGFCNSTTRTTQLVRCVKQWITFLVKCGFKPVTTVCDQGGSNTAAIKTLIKETNEMRQKQHKKLKNTFIVKNQEVIPLYDYVHLQKGIRNNLLNNDIVMNKTVKSSEKRFATWKDIVIVYEMDKNSFLRQRQMPKLTDRHIFPHLIPKTKVKYATQAISHTVANFIDVVLTLNKGSINTTKGNMHLPANAEATSECILFFDNLFDSFNAKKGKENCSIITKSSNHILFWHNSIDMLRKMDFIESDSHKYIHQNAKCLSNWIWTIRSAQRLWNTLQKSGFTSLNLKFLNQDPIENCFSQIRDHINNNPTPYQFCALFKTLITTNFTSKHSISSNCKEEYEGKPMSLEKIISKAENMELIKNEEPERAEMPIPEVLNIFINVEELISILTDKIKCENCAKCLQNEETVRIMQYALQNTELKFLSFCHEVNIKVKVKSILYLEAFTKISIHCATHEDFLIEKTAQHFIIQWCKYVNKLLKGTLEDNYSDNYMYNEARRMSMRFQKHKLKQK
ncbi:uncharacterized protein LOC105836495 isoform X2 [Monomorium pharaonis]|uniref:uncharacterized protein LOC105836495 isoform X2 n=1 Tax=Monomorium pharaonis TaxID=307658 RepID=UPI00063F1B55|nr:uncharacterized protein LOC105836495 isoform X2 [Monomorium pharaonis]